MSELETISFETYTDMYLDYERSIENEEYDNEMRIFVVPKHWAVDFVFIHYMMSLDDFLNEYTWDESYEMYTSALIDTVIVSEGILER